jgi:hypothetical protein
LDALSVPKLSLFPISERIKVSVLNVCNGDKIGDSRPLYTAAAGLVNDAILEKNSFTPLICIIQPPIVFVAFIYRKSKLAFFAYVA